MISLYSKNSLKAISIFKRLQERAQYLPPPLTERLIQLYGNDPFIILISCLLSLRNRDTVTYPACVKLFDRVKTPQELVLLSNAELKAIISSINFYKRKAVVLHQVGQRLIDDFDSKVPCSAAELMSLPGVGPKTTNLVLSHAFNKDAVCVDTHVQKIAFRLGWASTLKPEKTQKELEALFPKKYWNALNEVLVKWGQNRCTGTVLTCPFHELCEYIYSYYSVKKKRVTH